MTNHRSFQKRPNGPRRFSHALDQYRIFKEQQEAKVQRCEGRRLDGVRCSKDFPHIQMCLLGGWDMIPVNPFDPEVGEK